MSTPIKNQLTKQEVDQILQLEETWVMDKKGKNITPAKLSHTVSALANTDGGEIYVGLSSCQEKTNYNWDGFTHIEECNQILSVISNLGMEQDECVFEFLYYQKSIVLHIIIQKTQKPIYATNRTLYRRVGAQNIPQETPEKIRQIEYDKGIRSYEDEMTSCTYDIIKNSSVLHDFSKAIVPKSNTYDFLKREFLINQDSKISVAGVLLYLENPQSVLPKHSAIRILRYKSDLREGSRDTLDDRFPISIEGDLYSLISSAVKKTIEIVEESDVIGALGMEAKKYPEITLHEIITNAVLHRDYSIASDIQIRIYTNRIEIESPGKLPGHITIDNILKEQYSRNGKIVRLISKFPHPPNKDVGEGLNTAFDAMAKMNLRKPIIKEKTNSVLVIIQHERLADHETTILNYLKDHDSINNAEGRKITGIADTIKMKDVFTRLRKQGALEMIPGLKGNQSRWRLVKNHSNNLSIEKDANGMARPEQLTFFDMLQ